MADLVIAFSVPVFFAFIGIEWALSKMQKKTFLRFNDVISNLGCGIGSQAMGLLTFGVLALGYQKLYEFFHLFELDGKNPWVFVVTLFAVDFIYYAWHRVSHRVNWIWAAHIVHHHSQDYNFSVALRQAWWTRGTQFFFHLPLAILGVPLEIFIVAELINTLYQFFIHTRVIGKLGPLEWIFNTPSHHRAHHGVNPEYIDKNYGGILIVWDRLFGTFCEEKAEVVYGTVQPLKSWNPLWANLHYWADLFEVARRCPSVREKFFVFLAPPEWSPDGQKTIPPVEASSFEKWESVATPHGKKYVAFQFILLVVAFVSLLAVNASCTKEEVLAAVFFILWATHSFSNFLSGNVDAGRSEALRLFFTLGWFYSLAQNHHDLYPLFAAVLVVTVSSILLLWSIFGPGGTLEE